MKQTANARKRARKARYLLAVRSRVAQRGKVDSLNPIAVSFQGKPAIDVISLGGAFRQGGTVYPITPNGAVKGFVKKISRR